MRPPTLLVPFTEPFEKLLKTTDGAALPIVPTSPPTEVAPVYGEAQVDAVPPPPRVSTGGGTLFERMSSLSRGLTRGSEEPPEDEGNAGVNIPRFLDRQSNN